MLPSFLNLTTALIAAGIAVPALLVLYFLRLRREPMKVASTFLWRKAVLDLHVNAPFQRLRRNLLLLLQLLLLVALLIALARPIKSGQLIAGPKTVIVIDRSGSMRATDVGGKARLDEAKRRANALVQTMRRDSRAMVIAFDDTARIVQPFTSDTAALRSAIDSITPSDRPTKLQLAYQLADAQMRLDPESAGAAGDVTMVVYTDGRVWDADQLSTRASVRYEKIGASETKNVGIVSAGAKRSYEAPSQVQVFVRMANYGPEPASADVRLEVAAIDPAKPGVLEFANAGELSTARLLPARFTDEQRRAALDGGFTPREGIEFTLDLTTAAVLRVSLRNLDGDALAADNSAVLVVPPPRPLRLLLVTGGNAFMETLCRAIGVGELKQRTPEQYEADKPADFDVVIFDNVAPTFLPPAGNFIFLGHPPDNQPVHLALDESGRPQFTENIKIVGWEREHPTLRGLNLKRLYVDSAAKLSFPLDAQVLIEGYKGALVVLHRDARGFTLTTAFDLLDSNWPGQATCVVFFLNAVQFMGLSDDVRQSAGLAPGATPSLPRGNVERLNVTEITLDGPMPSRKLSIPKTGDLALPALESAGLYRTMPPVPQYEYLPVNLTSEIESNTLPLDAAPGNVGQLTSGGGGEESNTTMREWWWWIVAGGAVPLLMLEWWVYTRRVRV